MQKNIHLDFYKKNTVGKFSNLTDNRYGQVEEKPAEDKYILDFDNNKILDKDAIRNLDYISPIEPYIRNGGESKDIIHNNLLKIICGIKDNNNGEETKDFRIVSMRIYKDDYAVAQYNEDRYVLNVGVMKLEKNIIKEIQKVENECPFCQTSIPEVHCKVSIEEIGFKHKNKQRPDYKKNNKIYDFEHWCTGCGRALGMDKII